MPPKKASAEPVAAIPEISETERVEDTRSKAAGRKVSPHPSTMEMVKEALKELDSRKGVSGQAIRGYIKEKYTTVDETRLKFMLRKALAKGLETGVFVRPANSAPTMTGAQGRFRIAKTKTKEAKAQTKENADPNVQKVAKPKKAEAPKAKGDGTSKETQKSKKKKAATVDAKPKMPEREGSASKVAPAKKPKAKNATGEGGTAPKASKAKKPKASKEVAEEPPAAAAKKGKKTAAKSEVAESGEKGGVTAAKASGKRGKK
ncbi:protein B4 [Triplophysa rosa]|uniref:Linker histone H1M n=1 Tax=Triplophysa rosa TaxID=992332 RepID=A0A9W7X3B1_TRIRA|nr:protein B4 [Triplophysa rosa]KAI7812928.1 putative linker histone H1M [Triplophysa rosa]